jgi:hypothetical protein
MHQPKDILVRGLAVLQTALTYGKKLLERAIEANKVYTHTLVNAILTNQRNHNTWREMQ